MYKGKENNAHESSGAKTERDCAGDAQQQLKVGVGYVDMVVALLPYGNATKIFLNYRVRNMS
jgi:hypothetical protein